MFRKIWNALFGVNNKNRRSRTQITDIVSSGSKIDHAQKAKPKSDRQLLRPGETLTQVAIPSSVLSKESKVDSKPSTRAKPNNPEIQALVDRLSGTVDAQ